MSLGHLENKVIRKFGDARIHTYINCASYSCPKLTPEWLTDQNLDRVLDERAAAFVNGHGVDASAGGDGAIGVSAIFKWYAKDFDADGGVLAWINHHRDGEDFGDDTKLVYLPYDWSLNDH